MKLYYSPGACSLASHIILNEINADYELEKVDIRKHITEKGTDYYQINPKGCVPALEIDLGLVLTENMAVLPFLAQNDPHQNLLPTSGLALAKVMEWLGFLNSDLHIAYGKLFKPNLTDAEKENAYKQIHHWLSYVEKSLENSSVEYLVNDDFGPADAYLFVITNWSLSLDVDLSEYPKLVALRKKIAERPSVQSAMKQEGLIK